jgi:hypothetical protein
MTMAEIVRVSTADVERAQLLIKLNDYVGKPTSEAIRKIASAQPINGHANGHARLDPPTSDLG